MSQSLYGSIDFSKLLEMAKAGHKSFSKSEKNGKIYLNVKVWVNDEANEHGNIASLQANFKGAEKEDRFYFGNLKESTPAAVAASEIPSEDDFVF